MKKLLLIFAFISYTAYSADMTAIAREFQLKTDCAQYCTGDQHPSGLMCTSFLPSRAKIYHVVVPYKAVPHLWDDLSFETTRTTPYFVLQYLMRLYNVAQAQTEQALRDGVQDVYNLPKYRAVFEKFAEIVDETLPTPPRPLYLKLSEASAEKILFLQQVLNSEHELFQGNRLSFVDSSPAQALLQNPFATPDGNVLGNLHQQLHGDDDMSHGVIVDTARDAYGVLVDRRNKQTSYYLVDPFNHSETPLTAARFISEHIEERRPVWAYGADVAALSVDRLAVDDAGSAAMQE